MGRLAGSLVAALMVAVAAHAAEPSPQVARELAPTGKLRAAINYGNPVLAQKTASGEPGGVSVELARELGKRLGVPVGLVFFDAAGRVFEASRPARGTSRSWRSIPCARPRSPPPSPTW